MSLEDKLNEKTKETVCFLEKYDWIKDDEFCKKVCINLVTRVIDKLCIFYDIPMPKIVFGTGCFDKDCRHSTLSCSDNLLGDLSRISINWNTKYDDIVEIFDVYSKCMIDKIPIHEQRPLDRKQFELLYDEWYNIDPKIHRDLYWLHMVCLVKELEFERNMRL